MVGPWLASLLMCGQALQAGSDSRAREMELATDIMHTLSPATFTGAEPEAAAKAARIRSRVHFGGWHGDGEHAVKIAAYERAEEEDQAARQQGVNRIWTRARFQNSSFVAVLSRKSAPALLRRNLPFAIFMLCDCPDDMDWHLPTLEHLLRENRDGLHVLERLVLLYALPPVAAALELRTMYGVSAPALVIDNVPRGARNERYHFFGNNTSPAEETYRFMAQFVNGSASPTLAGAQSGHHSLRYKLADILAMYGDAEASAQAVEMLEDEIEIAARDGSDSDKQLLEAHAGHLCMLYLEEGTEEGIARAAELHMQFPSEEHCAPPAVRQDCEGEWSACTELCEAALWREWTEHKPPSGGGAPCPSAVDCQPGEDGCAPVSGQGGSDEREVDTPRIASRNRDAHGHTLYDGSKTKVLDPSSDSQYRHEGDEEEEYDGEDDEGTEQQMQDGEQASAGSPTTSLPPAPPTPPLAFGQAATLAAFRMVAQQYPNDITTPGAVGELMPQSVNRYMQAGRPFVVFMLCSCERDTDWHIQALSEAVRQRPELHQLSIVWTSPLTAKRFQLDEMYGVPAGQPALVIDNIPYGPMNERYVFKHSNRDDEMDAAESGGSEQVVKTEEEPGVVTPLSVEAETELPIVVRNQDAHGHTLYKSDILTTATRLHEHSRRESLLEQILAFLDGFVDGSLQPDVRSAPAPDGGAARGPVPGKVTEVVGSTFEHLVRDWVPAVPPLVTPGTHQPQINRIRGHGTRWTFMFFYSRTCPACTEAMPTIERLAADMKEYAFLNDDEPLRPLLHIARVEKPFNDFAYRGLMITHYPTAYLFSVDENEETGDGKRVQSVAYADYSGENAAHDHHHAAHDHWEMSKLRQFIEAVVGISTTTEVPKPPPPLTPQHGVGVHSAADNAAATGHGGMDSERQTPGKRGAGWSHAQQLLQVLTRQLADPALMGAGRLALEQQVRALSQAEKGGWTEAELNKLKRDGYLS
eukprot:COSAG02_NODE_2476_length_8733_cov_9.786542_2_plen_980_part_00